MASSLPTPASFTTKVDGVDRYLAAHMNAVQDEIAAIERGQHSSQTVTEAVLVSGIDFALGETAYVTLTANRVMGAPLNPIASQRGKVVFIEGGAGNFTVTLPSAVSAPNWTLNLAVGAITELPLEYYGTTSKWLFALNPSLGSSGNPGTVASPLQGVVDEWGAGIYNVVSPQNPTPALMGTGTDNTAAVQAAANALPVTGGVIYVPGPVCRIDGTVTFPTATKDVTFMGSGISGTEIRLGAAGALIGTSTTRLTIADMRITSTGTGNSFFAAGGLRPRFINARFEGGGHHINLNNCFGSLLLGTSHYGHNIASAKDVFVAGSFEGSIIGFSHAQADLGFDIWPAGAANPGSIYISGASQRWSVIGGIISRLDFTQATSGAALTITNTSQYCSVVGMVIVDSLNCDAVGITGSASDIDLVGVNASHNSFQAGAGGNNATGDGFDIFGGPSGQNALTRIRVVGCTGRNNGQYNSAHSAVEVFQVAGDVSFDGCDFSDNGGTGVFLSAAPDVTIANTSCRRNWNSGIYAEPNTYNSNTQECLNLKILGCDCSDNNTGAHVGVVATQQGIYLKGNTEALIMATRCTDTAALASKNQNYGIYIDNAGGNAFAKIIACDVRGNKTGPINDVPGLSYIAQTDGYNPVGAITMAVPASGVVTSFPVSGDGTLMVSGGTLTAIKLGGLPTPAAPTLAAATTGGTLATLTYGYKVSALGPGGETIASAEATIAVTGPTGKITLTATRIRGARGYYVYGRTSGGAWQRMGLISSGLIFIDDGSVTPAAPSAPVADASGQVATGITAAAAAGSAHTLPADYGGAVSFTYTGASTLVLIVR